MNRNLYLSLIKKIGLGFVFALYLSLSPGPVYANSSSCPVGTTMNFVAHEDDDMLFLNPDIQNDIHAGRCVITVYLTAGDAGLSTTYWQNRENGEKASYSIMSSALNLWTQQDAGITGHPIPVFTLTTAPNKSLIFLRLPDGNNDGLGFTSTNYQTLQKLWQGNIPTITAINNSSSYTKQGLINTLLALMNTYQPDIIRTQNFVDSYNSAIDHSDHYTTAYLAQAASQAYSTSHILIGYYDYQINSQPQNIFGTDVTAKENTFISYTKYDPNVCQTLSACLADPRYGGWFLREYTVATITPTPTLSPTPTATPTATPTPTPAGGTQLLTGPWTFSGNNGSAEKNTSIPVTSLFEMTSLLTQFNLHGSIFGNGDDEASIVFVQNNDWYMVNLIGFGINGFDGLQTVSIPLSAFHKFNSPGTILDLTKAVTGFHARFWNSGQFLVDLNSVEVFKGSVTPTPTPTITITPTPTVTPTITPTVTPTPTPPSGGNELLTSGTWTLSGGNGSAEEDATIASNTLTGNTSVQITLDLHGAKFGLGDDEASVIFIQNNDWYAVNLLNYGTNQLNGPQTVTIPLTDFHKAGNSTVKLDPTQPVTNLHVRFWNSGTFTVDIGSVKVTSVSVTPTPTPTITPTPTVTPTPTPTVTPTPTPPSGGNELLTSGTWTLSGGNGSAEEDIGLTSNVLTGRSSVSINYDLHGTQFGPGDDEASLIFIQSDTWYAVNIVGYGVNGMNGQQTVTVPLSAFHKVGSPGAILDLTKSVSGLHARFWNKDTFTVDIFSVNIQ